MTQLRFVKKSSQTSTHLSIVPVSITSINQEIKKAGYKDINDISSKILAMLNEAGIDLMVSGHIHRYAFHESVPGIRNYPILVGSNSSGARIDIDESGIALKVFDRDGTILLDKKL